MSEAPAPAPAPQATEVTPPTGVTPEVTDLVMGGGDPLVDAQNAEHIERSGKVKNVALKLGRRALHFVDTGVDGAINLKQIPSITKDALQLRKDRKTAKQLHRFGTKVDTSKLTYKYEVDADGNFTNPDTEFSDAKVATRAAEATAEGVKTAANYGVEKVTNGKERVVGNAKRAKNYTTGKVRDGKDLAVEKITNGKNRVVDRAKKASEYGKEKVANGKDRVVEVKNSVVDGTLELRAKGREAIAKHITGRRAARVAERQEILAKKISDRVAGVEHDILDELDFSESQIAAEQDYITRLTAEGQAGMETLIADSKARIAKLVAEEKAILAAERAYLEDQVATAKAESDRLIAEEQARRDQLAANKPAILEAEAARKAKKQDRLARKASARSDKLARQTQAAESLRSRKNGSRSVDVEPEEAA